MGNGPGSLTEYVELMERSRRIQGYFVWEWRDHGVYTERADGKHCYRYGGEFGEDYHSGNFCMDGLLAADGTPTPGFYAYAKAVEPFHTEMDARGWVTLESRFAFRTVQNGTARWTLRVDGETELELLLPLAPIAPGSVTVLEAPGELLPAGTHPGAHRTLTASFAAGTEELGSAAAVLETYAPRAEEPKGAVRVLETPERIAVAGERFSLYVSLSDGRIRDYVVNGQTLAGPGPTPDLFRAYLDNDVAFAREWTKRNLHSMVPTVLSARWETRGNCAVITLRLRYGANARNWRVLAEARYAVCADGSVGVSMRGRFDGDFGARRVDTVPRIGTTLRLPGCYQQVAYCGWGPGETYCDSRQNGRKDVFYTTVDALSFRYECPQDSGNRTDTDWIALYDGDAGLAIASPVGRDVSAHNCESRDLWKASHACDVPRRPFVELHVDARNAGLGSGSCGPGPLSGYSAQTVPFDIRYALAPMGARGPLAAARHAGDVLAAVDRWL